MLHTFHRDPRTRNSARMIMVLALLFSSILQQLPTPPPSSSFIYLQLHPPSYIYILACSTLLLISTCRSTLLLISTCRSTLPLTGHYHCKIADLFSNLLCHWPECNPIGLARKFLLLTILGIAQPNLIQYTQPSQS